MREEVVHKTCLISLDIKDCEYTTLVDDLNFSNENNTMSLQVCGVIDTLALLVRI